MKTTIAVILFFLSSATFAQEFNRRQTDEKVKGEILIGLCNKQGYLETPFSDWFKSGYDAYKPDIEIITQLKPYADKYKITVVLGTWCSDSRREIPRFFKVMDNAGYSPNSIKVICVDSQKTAGDTDISTLKFEKVPTIIVTNYNKELGRIVEKPTTTIEADLLNILQKD